MNQNNRQQLSTHTKADPIPRRSKDEQCVTGLSKQVIEATGNVDDQASDDLAIRRIDIHQQNAWMLRSHLE